MYRIIFIFCFVLLLACKKKEVINVSEKSVQNSNQNDEFYDLISTYERPDRNDWQMPDQVIRYLGDSLEKLVVAEIGAGSGYFTFRILPLVKKMIAIDIDPRMISFIDSTKLDYLDSDLQNKLETRLATENDSKINPGEVDVVFLSNTYAYINEREIYFNKIRQLLKPEGRVVIVDYKKRRIPVGPDKSDKVALYQVEEELLAAGFSDVYSNDRILPYQYIVLALLK